MALYDRLVGFTDAGVPVDNKIPVHPFQAVVGEFARGVITGQQVQDAITSMSGAPLSPPEITEAQALLATVTGTAAVKLARAKLIDDVLLLADVRVVYTTPSSVKTRLGV